MPNFQIFEAAEKAITTLPMEGIVERAADRQEDRMIDLNVEQMEQGIKADGDRIIPPYKPSTVSRKKKMGQPTDRVTLKDTGDFHNSVRVKRFPKMYELVAQDWKSEQLQEKYTHSILGLTDFSLQQVREAMKPFMRQDVKKLTKIKR